MGPNFPEALAIAPQAPSTGADDVAWAHDSADDIAQYGIAGRIWESAFLVESYVHAPSTWTWDPPRTIVGAPQARTILELGSGVGTAGLTTAMALDTQQTHDLIVTDLPDVCPLLARNTRDFHREGVRVHVRPLAWGDQDAARRILHEFRPTHLLCSDLVYFPDLLAPLLHTLLDVTDRVPDAQVVIAYKIRSLTKEQPFWTALGVWFDMAWTQCSTGPDQPLAPFGSHASHFVHKPPCDAQGRPLDDFFVLVAHRKSHTLTWTRPSAPATLLSGMHMVDGLAVPGEGTDTFEWMILSSASDAYLH